VSEQPDNLDERTRPCRVFLSYAHEDNSNTHSELVRRLYEFLRSHGVNAQLDLVAAQRRPDWSLWMADQIREADHILVIASPAYRERAQAHSGPEVGRGVQWEARLIRDAFYRDQHALDRFLPVILPGHTIEGIPDFLAPATTTVYHIREFTVAGAEQLLRLLTGQPAYTEPPLGPQPLLGGHAASPETEGGTQSDGALLVPGASTAVPSEAGPAVVHGRDDIVARLVAALGKQSPGRLQVLVGAGGMGKSTIARLVAAKARDSDQQRRIWWISATDQERLAGGLVSLARQLGVSTADQERIRAHSVSRVSDVADQIWDLLERSRRGWLLVIDNVDDPSLLGPPDGTGWIRRTSRGLVLITSRDARESNWPGLAQFEPVGLVSIEAATNVLMDLAPDAGSRDAAQALAARLGCLPQALRMAGIYLRREFIAWHTFDEYRRALNHEVARVIDASQPADRRAVVTQTWEMSLDALANSGVRQARPLLWLLSCYAPGSLIPEEIITARGGPNPTGRRSADTEHPLRRLLDPDRRVSAERLVDHCLDGLYGLTSVGLIQQTLDENGSRQIELHPFIAEVTQTVMHTGSTSEIDSSLVQRSAVAALRAAAWTWDVGYADHWQYFQALTPHVHHLLSKTARHLGQRQRRELLDCMTRCVTADMWSRAEPRAELLAAGTLELAHQLGCASTPAYLRLQHVHAWSIREQDTFAEAEQLFQQVLTAQAALPHGMTRADTLRTRHDLAWTLGRQGQWRQAEEGLRDVLRLRRERLKRRGQDHDDVDILHTRCMLCWCIGKQGHWDRAEQGYRLLLADRATTLGSDHPDTLDTRESLAKTIAWQGRWADAESEFHTLAAERARWLGGLHPDTVMTRQLEAYAAGYQALLGNNRRRRRAAIVELQHILQIQQFARGDGHRNTRDTRACLAVLQRSYSPDMLWTEDLPRPDTNRSR
jgi:SEFIR domain/AAA ATPase domain/Tetratricopeptide repeat